MVSISMADILRAAKAKNDALKSNKTVSLVGTGFTQKVLSASAEVVNLEREMVRAAELQTDEPEDVGQIGTSVKVALMDDAEQNAAVEGAVLHQYFAMTGRAGTGKTTTTKRIIAALIDDVPMIKKNLTLPEYHRVDPHLDYEVPAVLFCAFMGKSVQQIKMAIDPELHPFCRSIHSALAFRPVTNKQEEDGGMSFEPWFGPNNPLPYQLVIIDEAGTCGAQLGAYLIASLPKTCRVIVIGDLDQLQPPTDQSILRNALAEWPYAELKTLHRNAGAIAKNSFRILKGLMPLPVPGIFDMVRVHGNAMETQSDVVKIITQLKRKGAYNPLSDYIIVAQNEGYLGQVPINDRLVHHLNAPRTVDNVFVNRRIVIKTGMGSCPAAVGDKIVLLANDNNRTFEDGTPNPLTNGMTGVIIKIEVNSKSKNAASSTADMLRELEKDADLSEGEEIDLDLGEDEDNFGLGNGTGEEELSLTETITLSERQASHVVSIMFEGQTEPVKFSRAGEFKKFALAYAVTCFKAQGGEYPTIVVICHNSQAVSLSRNWLYTAVTRARAHVILIYNDLGIKQALSRKLIQGETVEEKIAFIQAEAGLTGRKRTLPAPVIVRPIEQYKIEGV